MTTQLRSNVPWEKVFEKKEYYPHAKMLLPNLPLPSSLITKAATYKFYLNVLDGN